VDHRIVVHRFRDTDAVPGYYERHTCSAPRRSVRDNGDHILGAETRDKTQLATLALAVHFQTPIQVVLGATLGMLLANVPAVGLGDRLAQRVPMKVLQIAAALLFVAIGGLALLGLLREAP
jgi:hypothetical protein